LANQGEEVSSMAFSGEYQHGVDEKCRLIIPVKYRGSLGSRYMLSKGLEGCLAAYPMDAWARLEEKFNERSFFNLNNRRLTRRFFSGSDECEIDKQGRTLINQEFRNYGNITKDVYIIGAGDHLEIWNKDAWESYRAELDAAFEDLAGEDFQ